MQLIGNIQADRGDGEAKNVVGQYFFHCNRYLFEFKCAPDVFIFREGTKAEGEKEGAADKGKGRGPLQDQAQKCCHEITKTRKEETTGKKKAGQGFIENKNVKKPCPVPPDLTPFLPRRQTDAADHEEVRGLGEVAERQEIEDRDEQYEAAPYPAHDEARIDRQENKRNNIHATCLL